MLASVVWLSGIELFIPIIQGKIVVVIFMCSLMKGSTWLMWRLGFFRVFLRGGSVSSLTAQYL